MHASQETVTCYDHLVSTSAAYPVRRVDTKDFYLLPVGTKFTLVDGGITPGVLSEYYNEFYWNIGNDVIMPGNQRPRIAVHQQNFSLTTLNSQLSDGQTYICYVNVQTYTAEQKITILSHSKFPPYHNPSQTIGNSLKKQKSLYKELMPSIKLPI